jgi:predicted amidohydrolase YtcJ
VPDAPGEPAETLYRGAAVFTAAAGADAPDAEAVLVRGDRIAWVGSADEAARHVGPATQIVELDGGLLLPGFVDAHAHVVMAGEAALRAPLTSAPDLAEIQRRVRQWADDHPEAPRVLGRGWLFSAVPDGLPTRQMLDEVCPDRPVYLDANDYHSVWVNSAALAELGITADTPDPVGGTIARDPATGEPTGLIDETALQAIVWPFLAQTRTAEELDAQLDAAVAAYVASGVTGAVDMALGPPALAAIARAEDAGRLPFRIVGHWLIDRPGGTEDHLARIAEAARLAEQHRSDRLRVAGVKLIVDGVIDGCTAALGAPYANGATPEPIWDAATLTPAVVAADAAGLQIAMHAIGDAAVRTALDALEEAARLNGPAPRRHRIEHLEYVDEADVPRLAALGVIASMQPVHADPAIQDNWRAMLGDHRVERGFAWPEFTESGARLAFGSDAPTAPHEPLPNMYVAATRRSALEPDRPASLPHYALPLADALRHGTADAAWACGAEDERGSLTPGLLADFVVLDRDPFAEGPESLLEATVRRTVIGGETVYDAAAGGIPSG